MHLYILNCRFGRELKIVGIYSQLQTAQQVAAAIYGPLFWLDSLHGTRNQDLPMGGDLDTVIDTIEMDQELHPLETLRAALKAAENPSTRHN